MSGGNRKGHRDPRGLKLGDYCASLRSNKMADRPTRDMHALHRGSHCRFPDSAVTPCLLRTLLPQYQHAQAPDLDSSTHVVIRYARSRARIHTAGHTQRLDLAASDSRLVPSLSRVHRRLWPRSQSQQEKGRKSWLSPTLLPHRISPSLIYYQQLLDIHFVPLIQPDEVDTRSYQLAIVRLPIPGDRVLACRLVTRF